MPPAKTSRLRQFLKYAVPSVTSMWIFAIYTMVDGLFVAHGVGELALASVNLTPTDELLVRSPFSLSGGQQRSVALAGVLAMRQDVLVLDEPMAGLDPDGRRHVRDLLRALKRAGSALIMVTHSMEDVAELADHVIVLERGRALLSGSPAEVLPTLFEPEEVSPRGDSR